MANHKNIWLLALPLVFLGCSKAAPCSSQISGVQPSCGDNVKSPEGNRYAWRVLNRGSYSVQVTPPEHRKYPLDAQVVVKDPSGEVIADKVGKDPGSRVVAMLSGLTPATYSVTVKDVDATSVTGGFDYALEVRSEVDDAAPNVAAGAGSQPVFAPAGKPQP